MRCRDLETLLPLRKLSEVEGKNMKETQVVLSPKRAAQMVNDCYEAAEKGIRTAFEKALAAGEIFIRMKQELPHGRFLNWVREETVVPERTARKWMDLAANEGELKTATVAGLVMGPCLSCRFCSFIALVRLKPPSSVHRFCFSRLHFSSLV